MNNKQKDENELKKDKEVTLQEVIIDLDRRITELELLKGHEHNKDGKIVIPWL